MDVALIGEGTYPHQFGGVSVWCDQLVRGMTDYDFLLVALVATGAECPCGDARRPRRPPAGAAGGDPGRWTARRSAS